MTEIKLNSQTIDTLNTYISNLETGLNDALLNVSFNENEIKRLTGELEQVKARYLMVRSEANKTAIETLEKALEKARKDLQLDYSFLTNSEKRYSMIELTEQEYADIKSDLDAFMEPVNDKKAEVLAKIQELDVLVDEYVALYPQYGYEVSRAISTLRKACKKGTDRRVAVNVNVGPLDINSKLRDVVVKTFEVETTPYY